MLYDNIYLFVGNFSMVHRNNPINDSDIVIGMGYQTQASTQLPFIFGTKT